MPRDYRIYLEDMREAGRKVRRYVEGLSFEGFNRTGGLTTLTKGKHVRKFSSTPPAGRQAPKIRPLFSI